MRDVLSQEFLGVDVERWLFAIGVALLVTALLPLFRKINIGSDTEDKRAEIQGAGLQANFWICPREV